MESCGCDGSGNACVEACVEAGENAESISRAVAAAGGKSNADETDSSMTGSGVALGDGE